MPIGWLRLVEGHRTACFCSVQCFDLYWEQRRWREQRAKAMHELDVEEADLLPKR